jgi:hypothetical protein
MEYEVIKEPARVAIELERGAIVDYQPGDGTRYECVLAYRIVQKPIPNATGGATAALSPKQRWLIVRNLGIALDLSKQITLINFCIDVKVNGCWAALRPVLFVLGATVGYPSARVGHLHDYDPTDARFEAEMRTRHDGEPFDIKDAKLGRTVRRAVEAGG